MEAVSKNTTALPQILLRYHLTVFSVPYWIFCHSSRSCRLVQPQGTAARLCCIFSNMLLFHKCSPNENTMRITFPLVCIHTFTHISWQYLNSSMMLPKICRRSDKNTISLFYCFLHHMQNVTADNFWIISSPNSTNRIKDGRNTRKLQKTKTAYNTWIRGNIGDFLWQRTTTCSCHIYSMHLCVTHQRFGKDWNCFLQPFRQRVRENLFFQSAVHWASLTKTSKISDQLHKTQ